LILIKKFLYKLTPLMVLFFYSPFIYANQISDLTIEGVSIGDNLLEFLNEKEIIEGAEKTKNHYYYLKEPNKYSEVYIFKRFPIYDYVSVLFKRNKESNYFKKKKKYEIELVRGEISFINDFKGCLKKKNEVIEEVTSTFPGLKKSENLFSHPLDRTGRSTVDTTKFSFDNGDAIVLQCNDWEESFRLSNNYSEGFLFRIQKKEVDEWLSNY